MIHALKTEPNYFEDATSGRKPFEVRKNDRDFKLCDYIALNEYDPTRAERERYTGRSALFRITYVLDNPQYCKDGYVVLGITPCSVVEEAAGSMETVLFGQARK